MPLQTPIHAPENILRLLSECHQRSLEQEAVLAEGGKVLSAVMMKQLELDTSSDSTGDSQREFDRLMIDKFIALDEDKCHYIYQLVLAMRATNIVEAGTSFGVSTIYLALAISRTKAVTGKPGRVIATEKEKEKAAIARSYWKQCGDIVEKQIDLREGDLLETLKNDLSQIDLLLLDIWSALALPTLKLVQPKLRPGAVVLTDNTISSAAGYADLLTYLHDPENGFHTMTLPFTNGFEMSVYLPE